MSVRPAALLLVAVAALAWVLAARRRSSSSPVQPYPTPPLVQRPAPGWSAVDDSGPASA